MGGGEVRWLRRITISPKKAHLVEVHHDTDFLSVLLQICELLVLLFISSFLFIFSFRIICLVRVAVY